MYSRSFFEREDSLPLPDGYGGTALSQDLHTESSPPESEECIASAKPKDSGVLSRIFPSISSLFPLGNKGLFGEFSFGKEEILIIATAIFLFFSEDGDRECAVLLLILLFIN